MRGGGEPVLISPMLWRRRRRMIQIVFDIFFLPPPRRVCQNDSHHRRGAHIIILSSCALFPRIYLYIMFCFIYVGMLPACVCARHRSRSNLRPDRIDRNAISNYLARFCGAVCRAASVYSVRNSPTPTI